MSAAPPRPPARDPARRRRKLGRGLEALIGAADVDGEADVAGARELPVERIAPNPYQPRRRVDDAALDELAASIRAHGVLQPVVVRPTDDGRYQLVAGERRWRACQRAGIDTLPCVVRPVDDRQALGLALVENIQRRDLGALDEAQALKRLVDEFELTHQQAAELVGRSRASVSNLLRLLALPGALRQWLDEGQLDMGHARALLGLGDAADQVDAARAVIDRQLSVAATERMVRRWRRPEPDPANRREADADVARLEADLSERLGAPVTISHRASGRGRVSIAYHSLDELDGLLDKLR